MRRVLASLATALFIASPAAARDPRPATKVKPYVFESRSHQKVDAELGTFWVPENRSDPESRWIQLAYVRFKSTSKTPGNPIVYLAGGPGGSGVGTAMGSRFPLFMAFREIADVIAFDQRGTGMSQPNLDCPDPLVLPLDAQNRDSVMKVYLERARDCVTYHRDWERMDLRGYNTNESADDLEELRKVLGAKKIDLWAISYGTHLSFATIRRHPTSVGRAILAGTEGPDHTYKLPSNVDAHLAAVGEALKKDPVWGPLIPDFPALMRDVYKQLDEHPGEAEIVDPTTKQKVKVPVTKFALQVFTAGNMGTETVARFPMMYYAASKGDYAPFAQTWLALTRSSIGNLMSIMMDCYSGQTAARRERIAREAPASLVANYADQAFPDICEAVGNPDLGDAFRAPVKSDVPALFISGTLDGRTPITNAEEYAAGFTNARHLILDGAVHSDPLFLSSPKIKDVMMAFLRGEALPARQEIVVEGLKWMAPRK